MNKHITYATTLPEQVGSVRATIPQEPSKIEEHRSVQSCSQSVQEEAQSQGQNLKASLIPSVVSHGTDLHFDSQIHARFHVLEMPHHPG